MAGQFELHTQKAARPKTDGRYKTKFDVLRFS
jgi:hypothetical protein